MRSGVLKALCSRRLLAVVLLGFSSGLPLALTGATLQAWMKTENVDLSLIGLFSLVGLPYAFKFLWSPLMDRFVPPLFGRRRGWILLTQCLLIGSIALMAFLHPSVSPSLTALFAVLVSFSSASQDIVVDAYRTDVLEPAELGPGAALHVTGYRIAMLVSGSVALILADHLSWKAVYLLMACFMGVGVFATLLAPEPLAPTGAPHDLREAIARPWMEFFGRRGSFEVLGFILLYKIDAVMATALTTPFMMDLGFTKTDIGAVSKSVGLLATILGTLAGGTFMVKLGLKRSLWVFGLLQGLSTGAFFWLSEVGHKYAVMVVSIGTENFCSGMGTAAFMAFLMSVCDKRFSATQYALLTSFMALTRVAGGAPTGFLVQALGWPAFFVLCIFIMIPGLAMLLRYDRWTKPRAA